MQSSRPALQSAARATSRRRVRSAPAGGQPPLPPSRDLVGPPCPLSNLRPVYYAPLFPSLHSPSGWGDLAMPPPPPPTGESATEPTSSAVASIPRRAHPYSLAEFPTLGAASALSSAKEDRALAARLLRLDRLRRSLHADDLEWRWARYRFDAFNQAFWTKMNERFLRARDAYIARREREGELAGLAGQTSQRGERDLGNEAFPPRTSASVSPTTPGGDATSSRGAAASTEDVDLAPFYAEHLAETKRAYADYNKQLWRMQAGLIWPAVKASMRSWRWKWEVWRAGVGGSGTKDGVAGY